MNKISLKKIVKHFINKHHCIFKWFQICYICKFNVWNIIFCCFFIVRFFVIVVIVALFVTIFCLDIISNVNVNYFFYWKKSFRDFKIASFNSSLFCWLHFQLNDLAILTMCSQFSQSCMTLHEHCRFSLLSLSVEIENVDFCDLNWDCYCFWRITTLTCSIIFNFFWRRFYTRESFSRYERFFQSFFFAKFTYRKTLKFMFDQRSKILRRTFFRNRWNS